MADRRQDVDTRLGERFTARTSLRVGGHTLDRRAVPSLRRSVRRSVRRRARVRVRWRRAQLLVGVTAVLAVPATAGGDRLAPTGPGGSSPPLAVVNGAPLPLSGAPADAAVATPAAFARYQDVRLAVTGPELRLVGFHEAAFTDALPMTPIGQLVANHNVTKFAPPADLDGPRYAVLSSRGRGGPATSAADLAVPVGAPVRSPVTGSVSLVQPYLLYGRYADTRVEITPAARPDLRVVLIHLTDVRVAPGDAVVAGRTELAASANRFPFSSHVDRYVPGDPGPHVHVEVKAATPPAVEPGPSNPPATDRARGR